MICHRKKYCKIKRRTDLHTKISNNEHIGIIPEKKVQLLLLRPVILYKHNKAVEGLGKVGNL